MDAASAADWHVPLCWLVMWMEMTDEAMYQLAALLPEHRRGDHGQQSYQDVCCLFHLCVPP